MHCDILLYHSLAKQSRIFDNSTEWNLNLEPYNGLCDKFVKPGTGLFGLGINKKIR